MDRLRATGAPCKEAAEEPVAVITILRGIDTGYGAVCNTLWPTKGCLTASMDRLTVLCRLDCDIPLWRVGSTYLSTIGCFAPLEKPSQS